jgi:hypothetical protein
MQQNLKPLKIVEVLCALDSLLTLFAFPHANANATDRSVSPTLAVSVSHFDGPSGLCLLRFALQGAL